MVDNTVDNDLDFGVMEDLDKTPELGGNTPEVKEEVNPEDNPLANEDDKQADESDDEVDIPVDEQEESEKFKLKPKKQSARERVEEAVAKMRQMERERDEALAKLKAVPEAAPKEEKKENPVAKTGPTPDDLDENGEAKYPLGEYDPDYIKDFTRHVLAEELAQQKATQKAEEEAALQRQAVEELNRGWQERVQIAQETMPDLAEKGMKLESAFEGLDPQYGEYLAQTIMSLENGPEVLYYLSDNIEEAKALVAGGPLKATLGLGELNSMLRKKSDPPVKVTKAPEPPQDRARGTNGRFDVPDDTDDLEAFGRKFYGR